MQKFIVCLILSMLSMTLIKTEAQVTKMAPFKAPILHTSLNGFSDSASIPYQDIRNFIDMPLVVMDSARKKYLVSSFQVIYRRLGVTENEKTKKVMPAYTFSSERFSGNQLSALWQRIIREESKPTESIRFFDVIVKDENNRLMFAGDLLLKLR